MTRLTTPVSRLDETCAARPPVLRWKMQGGVESSLLYEIASTVGTDSPRPGLLTRDSQSKQDLIRIHKNMKIRPGQQPAPF